MPLSRRTVLKFGGTAALTALVAPAATTWSAAAEPVRDYPFTLGVASGDPRPGGVVIWTRLAPDPLTGTGGMPDRWVEVSWQVATDDGFGDVVRAGSVSAEPGWAHSVHVDVEGLLPDRVYFYRFRQGPHLSPSGRTRTLPAVGAPVSSLSLAAVSCQSFPSGRYAAYRHIADQDYDLVLHLGDYIYEGAGAANPIAGADRRHVPFRTISTLEEYRIRHAQYRTDPDLQAAHAAAPFVCVPDDHEVVNNAAGEYGANGNSTPEVYLPRRAAAFQAYYEHLPLPRASAPQGPVMQLYRRFEYGDLAQMSMLDTRQYRSPQLGRGPFQPLDSAAYDPSRSLTGPNQERWLLTGLAASQARWNVIGQQVYMAAIDMAPGPGQSFNTDKWDGYPSARSRITRFLHESAPRNPIVLSGDSHAAMVSDITLEHDPASPVVATEFLGSSISSARGDSSIVEAALAENPQVHYFNGRERGYLSCQVERDYWTSDLWCVDDPNDASSQVHRQASYAVEDGRPGAQEA